MSASSAIDPPPAPRRIDLFEAVKYDIRLHGFRFIVGEFILSTVIALAVALLGFLHAAHGGMPLFSGIYFLGFAVNSGAVVLLARRIRYTGTGSVVDQHRLKLYGLELIVMLLLPCTVALAALWQWTAGDLVPPALSYGDAP